MFYVQRQEDQAQPAFLRALSWRRIPLIMAMHSASVRKISATRLADLDAEQTEDAQEDQQRRDEKDA